VEIVARRIRRLKIAGYARREGGFRAALFINSAGSRLEVHMNEMRRGEDQRPSGGRGSVDQSRRDALAAQMASIILAVFVLYLLVACLHMFTAIL
jgi:hypothetical protein